ncbi:hypothetical protein V1498_04075 [Peribacillus sp. SCS-26]|uniref:hypothetical protein n=1 Tax=Paraperibacillus marinus TaxID=3115295 RepID=UPI00390687B0
MYIHFGQHRQLAVWKIWGEPERDISSICVAAEVRGKRDDERSYNDGPIELESHR